MKAVLYLLVLVYRVAYTNDICGKEKENVQYTVYDYTVDVIVYQCQITNIPCEKSDLMYDNVEFCVSRTYNKDSFAAPDCHRDYKGNKRKVKITVSTVKANLREDAILFDFDLQKYSSGKYTNEENVTRVWRPEDNLCGKGTAIYNGPVDVWTFTRNQLQRYVQGTIPHTRFTLELVKENDTCEKKLWKTNRYGIYASESKNSTTIIGEDIGRMGGEDLELVCDLTMTLVEQKDIEADLRKNFYYITGFGAVFVVWLVIAWIVRLTTNCTALKKNNRGGFNLLRALSTTATVWHLRKQEFAVDESLEVVHDYESVDYIARDKINK